MFLVNLILAAGGEPPLLAVDTVTETCMELCSLQAALLSGQCNSHSLK